MILRSLFLVGLLGLGGITCLGAQLAKLRRFEPEGGQCSFLTPGGKRPVFATNSKGEPDALVRVSAFCYDQPGCRCQLRYFDLPAEQVKLTLPELVGKYCFEEWGNTNRIENQQAITQGAYSGVEYRVAGVRGVRIRVFRVGPRVYVLSAICMADLTREAESAATAFLDSFRIHGNPAEAQDDAANGFQPIRSETNSTSPAANSRR